MTLFPKQLVSYRQLMLLPGHFALCPQYFIPSLYRFRLRHQIISRGNRVVAAVVIFDSFCGWFWQPMHRLEVIAAGGGTLTDTMVCRAISGNKKALTSYAKEGLYRLKN
jgi:hypothetical protein